MPDSSTLAVELSNVSPHGQWRLVGDEARAACPLVSGSAV